MRPAAGTAIAAGNRHNPHHSVQFFFAAVFHCLKDFFTRKFNLQINVLSDGLIHQFFQLGDRFHRNFSAEINGNIIRIHMESDVFKFIFLMNEARENMFAGMILHIVKTAVPVELSSNG